MKFSSAFILFFLSSGIVFGQLRNPSSTRDLAGAIAAKYLDNTDKVRAAYTWVTTNIRYNTTGTFAMNNSVDGRAKIDKAFEKRAGVCENFASIFVDLCQEMGLPAQVIDGIAGTGGSFGNSGHSWASVNIDGSWYLFDPTWDIGKNSGLRFFKKSGEEFAFTHVPFDPDWQLTGRGANPPVDGISAREYNDSAGHFTGYDSLRMLESATERIGKKGPKGELAETHLKVLQNELETKRQEEQMVWFNRAVDLMNAASDSLNNFIDLRNAGFQNLTSAHQLETMLAIADRNLDSAFVFLTRVDQSKAVLVYGTEPAKEQLNRLRTKCRDQRSFLETYLAAAGNREIFF